MKDILLNGFPIATGIIQGKLYYSEAPYSDHPITSDTILVVDYPASTFLRQALQAGGVIAEGGTSMIEMARHLADIGKPVIFGVGEISVYSGTVTLIVNNFGSRIEVG